VPLITVLFMASIMLPLFMPQGTTVDKLLRALVGVTLFSSAYMAEVVRGGMQAIGRGQYEAAQALGLGYWRRMGFIVLPQALKHVIPGHRQQLHLAVQGHLARLHRRHLRPARGGEDQERCPRMGLADPGSHRLHLRRRRLLGVLFLHVPLFDVHGARLNTGHKR
jgi:hypothetical protein